VSAPEPPRPSYDELAALVVGLAARVETLEAENAELRRRLGMNSTNSSVPPSKDSIEAKAKRRADRSSRERSKDRNPVGSRAVRARGWRRR
jgi:transposase